VTARAVPAVADGGGQEPASSLGSVSASSVSPPLTATEEHFELITDALSVALDAVRDDAGLVGSPVPQPR